MKLPFSERDFLYLIYGERLNSPVAPLKMNYYQDLYARWQNGERSVWNWMAFFASFFGLGSAWLIYKRLYLLAFVYLLFNIFIFSVCLLLFAKGSIETFKVSILAFNFLSAIAAGLFGNSLHLLWLASWKKAFPQNAIPCGGDISGVLGFFALIFFSLGLVQTKLSGLLTVALFGLLVFLHIHFYEKNLVKL